MGLNNIKINNTTNVKTGVVYDISKVTGQSYETLSDALGTDGKNVPLEVREGGMSVRFVTSDNKYIQFRLMSDTFSTNDTDWQGVDKEVIAGSHNLLESNGVVEIKSHSICSIYGDITEYLGFVNGNAITSQTDYYYGEATRLISIPIKANINGNHISIINNSSNPTLKVCVNKKSISTGKISGVYYWSTSKVDFSTIDSDAYYFIIGIAKTDDSAIYPSDVNGIVVTTVKGAFDNSDLKNITSLVGLDLYKSGEYHIGSKGTRVYYTFPIFAYSNVGVTVNSGYSFYLDIYNSAGTRLYHSSKLSSYNNNKNLFSLEDVAYIVITFLKSDDSAMTVEDVIENTTLNIDAIITEEKKAYVYSSKLVNKIISDLIAAKDGFAPLKETPLDLSIYTPANGYINESSKWKDVESSNRRHIVIPVSDIKALCVFGNGNYNGYISFLSAYNVVEDGSASTIGAAFYAFGKDEVKSFAVPDGANYIYFQYNSSEYNYLPRLVYKNDSISSLDAELSKAVETLGKSLDYTPIRITSIDAGLDEYCTLKYNIGKSNARIEYRFPILMYSHFSITMNADYQVYVYLYDKNLQLLYQRGWIDSFESNDSLYESYPNVAFIALRFKKVGDAAFTFDDVFNNAISSLSFEYVKPIWNNKTLVDLTVINNLIKGIKGINSITGDSVDFSQYTPVNGYINNGVWTDVTSTFRKHIAIPINNIKSLRIKANSTYATQYAFLTDYNVSEGSSANTIGGGSTKSIAPSNDIVLTVPENAQYLYLQYSSGNYIYLPIKLLLGGDINDLTVYQNPQDILDLNPEREIIPKIQNLTRRYYDYGSSTSYPSVCTLIHCSDVHADNTNILRIKRFKDKYAGYINDVLDTGDFIGGSWSDGLPSSTANVSDFLRVVGNHDTTIRVGTPPNHHWELVGQLDCYNQNMKDYIGGWNVTQPTDAATYGYCYYYKDYANSNVRLICLDGEHWDETELTWLQNTLADAKTNGLHVVIAVHRPPFLVNPIQGNTFDSVDWPNGNSAKTLDGLVAAVNTFKAEENGVSGNFVCYLCGHIHQDVMGLGQDAASGQLMISIATAGVYPATPYSEMARTYNYKNQDCFNIVGIETHTKILKLMRIGAQYDRHMRKRDTFCWDYGTNTLVYCD